MCALAFAALLFACRAGTPSTTATPAPAPSLIRNDHAIAAMCQFDGPFADVLVRTPGGQLPMLRTHGSAGHAEVVTGPGMTIDIAERGWHFVAVVDLAVDDVVMASTTIELATGVVVGAHGPQWIRDARPAPAATRPAAHGICRRCQGVVRVATAGVGRVRRGRHATPRQARNRRARAT